MGRVYPGEISTEITSMGLEMLVMDPVRLFKDREMFEFILQIISGEI